MAGLNTLRSRGGVIITIVIGLALVAFLLGDLTSNGSSMGSKMSVGKINGTDISYSQYQNQIDYMTQIQEIMTGNNSRSTADFDALREQAWDQLITDYAFDPGFAKLGLAVGNDEALDMVDGKFISPVISQIFVNPQTGFFDPAMVKNYIANLDSDQSGNARTFWNFVENQMIQQRLMSKFVSLVEQGVFVTNFEVAQTLPTSDNLFSANVVGQAYTTVADSAVKVSQADLRKYYDQNQETFKQVASRDIEYVVFDVFPSESDYSEAQTYVTQIAEEFARTANVAQYVGVNSQSPFNPNYFKESELDPAMANFAFGGNTSAMYGPVLDGDTYIIARIDDVKMMADTMGALHIQFSEDKKDVADSVLNALKKGGNFAELATKYSVSGDSRQGGDMGQFTYNQLPAEIADKIFAAKNGELIKVESSMGTHIFSITSKSAESKKVRLGVITYKVDASSETQQKAYSAASKFISEAQGSLENFNNSVISNGVNKRVARVYAGDKDVKGFDNSRELVRWAFSDAKAPVSTILEINNNYVIAALTAKRKDGIAPFEQVKNDIMPILIAEKKADYIADKMKSFTSVSQASAALGVAAVEVKDLDINAFFIPEIGLDPTLIGAICSGSNVVGKLSHPIKSNSGVYLFELAAKTPVEDVNAESVSANLNANASSYVAERALNALRALSNIKDGRSKFF